MQSLTAVQNVASASADAWHWWVGELSAMIPERLKARFRPSRSSQIHLRTDAVEILVLEADGDGRRYGDARSLEMLDEAAWAELLLLIDGTKPFVILSPPDCFVTEVRLPRAAQQRLRSAVELQMWQISPLDPSIVKWEAQVLEADEQGLIVQVGMARATRIEAIQSAFELNGLDVPAIHARTASSIIKIASGRAGSYGAAKLTDRKIWLIAFALICSIPFTIAGGAMLLSSAAQDEIAELQETVAPRLKAEREARNAETVRRALRLILAPPQVGAIVEELAAILPSTDHVQALEKGSGREVQIIAEVADTDAADIALDGSEFLANRETVDVTPTDTDRMRVTYKVRIQ
ncbi:hypothetical protein [Allosphingosinicella vermicomposti]|uniref:hypothetical protein n=1 Tax=Allosphingosinicella vermicomposti TaxID=614671 RepID=UPI000D0F88C3|nr:hypothetical protein [Allosphingosinicella vermicomposti]